MICFKDFLNILNKENEQQVHENHVTSLFEKTNFCLIWSNLDYLISSLPQTRGYSTFEKWPAFKEDLKRFQPPGELIFQGYCRIYCRSSNNLSRNIGQNFWWYIANRLSRPIPVFVAFFISKEFSCGFTRTLTQLCEGYDCIVMLL